MAIINRVPELVAQRFGGADKINKSEVQKDTRLTYSTVTRWIDGEIDRVDFPVLEIWCEYLGVEPGDILVRRKDKST